MPITKPMSSNVEKVLNALHKRIQFVNGKVLIDISTSLDEELTHINGSNDADLTSNEVSMQHVADSEDVIDK